MGRTACTEPQCLHKGALYLTFLYYHLKASNDNLIFNQTIFNYITLMSFGITKDPLTFKNTCRRIIFKIFWHNTISHENRRGVHKGNQWQWQWYCGNLCEFVIHWGRIPCHRQANYTLQPPRTKYKRKIEKDLVEFFELGSRNSVKNLVSRKGNTRKEIKMALLREGRKFWNEERGIRLACCISTYPSLFVMTNSYFASAMIRNAPHNALKNLFYNETKPHKRYNGTH